ILQCGSSIRANVTDHLPPTTAATAQAPTKPSVLQTANQVPHKTLAARSMDNPITSQRAATTFNSENTRKTQATTFPVTTKRAPSTSPIMHTLITTLATTNTSHMTVPVTEATAGPNTSHMTVPVTEATAGPNSSHVTVPVTEATIGPNSSHVTVPVTEATIGPNTSHMTVPVTEATISPNTSHTTSHTAAPVTEATIGHVTSHTAVSVTDATTINSSTTSSLWLPTVTTTDHTARTSPSNISHTTEETTQPSNQTTYPAMLSTSSHNSTASQEPTQSTHTLRPTTAVHNATQTTSVTTKAPRPTLSPQPSAAKTGIYQVFNGSSLCIKAEMGIELIVQDTESRYFNIDPNATHASGNCGSRKSDLLLNFPGGFVNFTFTKDGNSYYISEVGAYLTVSNPEKTYKGMKSAVMMFETVVGHSFKCVSEQSIQLSGQLQLKTVDVQLQAFDFEGLSFGNVDECSSDYTIVLPVIGAIVLGLCAVGLIVYGIRLRPACQDFSSSFYYYKKELKFFLVESSWLPVSAPPEFLRLGSFFCSFLAAATCSLVAGTQRCHCSLRSIPGWKTRPENMNLFDLLPMTPPPSLPSRFNDKDHEEGSSPKSRTTRKHPCAPTNKQRSETQLLKKTT
ncbi:Lysosome-associated membrane glycoprotein 3, partial [Galemys pyrenaicus]